MSRATSGTNDHSWPNANTRTPRVRYLGENPNVYAFWGVMPYWKGT